MAIKRRHITKFFAITIPSFIAVYLALVFANGYVSKNFDPFQTVFEVRLVAMSVVNTFGMAVVGVSAILAFVIGFFYVRYIEK